jgi:hypothetical protein
MLCNAMTSRAGGCTLRNHLRPFRSERFRSEVAGIGLKPLIETAGVAMELRRTLSVERLAVSHYEALPRNRRSFGGRWAGRPGASTGLDAWLGRPHVSQSSRGQCPLEKILGLWIDVIILDGCRQVRRGSKVGLLGSTRGRPHPCQEGFRLTCPSATWLTVSPIQVCKTLANASATSAMSLLVLGGCTWPNQRNSLLVPSERGQDPSHSASVLGGRVGQRGTPAWP